MPYINCKEENSMYKHLYDFTKEELEKMPPCPGKSKFWCFIDGEWVYDCVSSHDEVTDYPENNS